MARRRNHKRIKETAGAKKLRLELEAASDVEIMTITLTDPRTGEAREVTCPVMRLPSCGSKESAINSVVSKGAFGRRR